MESTISKARAATGVPITYVNDEHGRWDSDAPALIRAVLERDHGVDIVKCLAPHHGDHVLQEHRYSAFHHTPLDLLLEQL